MSPAPLPHSFYAEDTVSVALSLIGCQLHRVIDGHHLVGRIVETEAYCGPEDDASHSAKGRTARTEVMFGPPGHAYVYLIYGMWNCFNVVTGPAGRAEAVLIRAIEPLVGIEEMRRRRSRTDHLADGPGKLGQALGITRADNGVDLREPNLFVSRGAPATSVIATPRIGIDYAVKCRDELWRFVADTRQS